MEWKAAQQRTSTPVLLPTKTVRNRRVWRQISVRCRDTCVQSCLEQPRLRIVGVFAQHQTILYQIIDGTHHRAVVLAKRRIALLD